jgi:hypothetical protein
VITGLRLLCACGVAAMSMWLAAPAAADPDPDVPPPCTLGFLCGLVPAMPDLDHDIDLTKGQPPSPPDQETRIADPCFGGCI